MAAAAILKNGKNRGISATVWLIATKFRVVTQFDTREIFNVWDSQEGRTASACQILSKSLKPQLRYGDFSIFQDGGRRHLGFWKFQIINGWDAQEGRTASVCHILSKSLKPWRRYVCFWFFKMAAAHAAILYFWNYKFLTVGTVHVSNCVIMSNEIARTAAVVALLSLTY